MSDYANKPAPKANAAVQHERPDTALSSESAGYGPSVAQLKTYGDMANNSSRTAQLADLQKMGNPSVQKKSNRTGLPDNLKSGIENLSGHSMDDVKIHYNSSQPAQLNAHAYAQGSHIHLAPGQEKHLPHEAWHVVQQKQGRVQPTTQLKGKNINDNDALEKEADTMGATAQLHADENASDKVEARVSPSGQTVQRRPIPRARAQPQAAAGAGSAAAATPEGQVKAQAAAASSNAAGAAAEQAVAAPEKPHDDRSAAGAGAQAAAATAPPQNMAQSPNSPLLLQDHRNPNYIITPVIPGLYDVIGPGQPFRIYHLLDSDQYLLDGKNVYWDPETGMRFTHVQNEEDDFYVSEGSTECYVYSHGSYMPIRMPSAGFETFMADIWNMRNEIFQKPDDRERLKSIYSKVYLKGAAKQAPVNKTPTIEAMVGFFGSKLAYIQGAAPIPPNKEAEEDINVNHALFKQKAGQPQDKAFIAAQNNLSHCYYYLHIRPGLGATGRILINIASEQIPAAMQKLYPILTASPIVDSVKAAGPSAAAKKGDSIVVYVAEKQSGQGFNTLLQQIRQLQLGTVNYVPRLSNEKSGGIAVADEPEAMGDATISFGDKRCIIGYMALMRARSVKDMLFLASAYAWQAGINPSAPSYDAGVRHALIKEQLKHYGLILRKK